MQSDKSFARRLYSLLNNPSSAKRQYQRKKDNPEGKWTYGKAFPATVCSFEAHLAGKTSLAPCVVTGGFANFIGWDLDENFDLLLAFFADRLRSRGWQNAAFATTGSSSGRGKIVLCFKPRIPQVVAHRIAHEIFEEVRSEVALTTITFGEAKPSIFPSLGLGANVRILGRNKGREGPLEIPLDLNGKPSDLRYVKPVRIDYDRKDAVSPQPARWAMELIESAPLVSSNDEAYKIQIRLADEALRLRSDNEAEAVPLLSSWCASIAAISSGNASRQFSRTDAIQRAVQYVLRNRRGPAPELRSWIPLDLTRQRLRKGARRIYEALAGYVTANRLNPHCFGMDYGRLAAMAGYADKSQARKATDDAEDLGLLFRLDRGTKNVENLRGLVTLFCLRGAGELLQDAYDDGVRSDMFTERLQLSGEPRITLVDGQKVGFSTPVLAAA